MATNSLILLPWTGGVFFLFPFSFVFGWALTDLTKRVQQKWHWALRGALYMHILIWPSWKHAGEPALYRWGNCGAVTQSWEPVERGLATCPRSSLSLISSRARKECRLLAQSVFPPSSAWVPGCGRDYMQDWLYHLPGPGQNENAQIWWRISRWRQQAQGSLWMPPCGLSP